MGWPGGPATRPALLEACPLQSPTTGVAWAGGTPYPGARPGGSRRTVLHRHDTYVALDEPHSLVTGSRVGVASDPGLASSPATPFEVVTAVARLIGETLELRQVFARVAEAARGALQFDRMNVFLWEGPEVLRYHAVAVTTVDGPGDEEGRLLPRNDCSPRFWRDFVVDRVDAQRELDPAFLRDREILDAGIRSIIRGVLRSGGRTVGILAFYSRQPEAFASDDEPVVATLADLVAAALEHERLFSIEREHGRRALALEALLPTLARALDIREVFQQVSEITQGVISHDLLVLSLLRPDGTSVGTRALLPGGELEDLPPPNTDLVALYQGRIVRDIEVLDPASRTVKVVPLTVEGGEPAGIPIRLDPVRFRHVAQIGVRSLVAVPVRTLDRFVGGLVFLSRRPNEYRPEHAGLARRVADHVALALAHQRLAEEERRAAEARGLAARLVKRVESLTQEIESLGGRRRIVGDSSAWKEVLKQATQVAATDTTVLLLGESGTGKEVVARFIHRASPRADGPFIALNCAALPDQLLESELFGHEKGAFTGAAAAKPGQIERAARGVLFLDEVGEMSLAAQAKLLRVLQEREFQRLGGTRTLSADVRVVAATNRDLRAAVEGRTFREDLYYRLQVFEIRLPPLRDRRDDILALSEEFLAEIGRAIGRPPAGISRDARDRLLEYHWPGNARELRNTLERAAILCEGGLINAEHLSLDGPRVSAIRVDDATPLPTADTPLSTAADLQAIERSMVDRALRKARYNKTDAARALGLTRKQLYVRLRRFGLH
jgi:transcriptional regulator with GAF, ATPase, and Fis domain